MKKFNAKKMYKLLLDKYGPQGWWPIIKIYNNISNNISNKLSKNNKLFECEYYTLSNGIPKTKNEQWEIIIGCLLTQNTQWHPNVTTTIFKLKSENLFHAEKLINTDINIIKKCIKSAGYFNQKSERLILLAHWFLSLDDSIPSRNELLKLKGIGPETADSILLYAFNIPSFVIDTYTKRILFNLKIINNKILNDKNCYNIIKSLFEQNLASECDSNNNSNKKNNNNNLNNNNSNKNNYNNNSNNNNLNNKSKIFKEFHALLVKHAKTFYQKKSTQKDDWLLKEKI